MLGWEVSSHGSEGCHLAESVAKSFESLRYGVCLFSSNFISSVMLGRHLCFYGLNFLLCKTDIVTVIPSHGIIRIE